MAEQKSANSTDVKKTSSAAVPKEVPKYTKEELHGCIAEETSFSKNFPQYKEAYIKECFPLLKATLDEYGIKVEIDLVKGSLTVSTTKETWDPYAIMKARDMMKLLARSVPFQQAKRILCDDMACDIIKIGSMVKNKDIFVKRRDRLIGPNGTTLKAIELLSQCYVLIQGSTCSAIGSYKGLSMVRKIVVDCMQNIHPVYSIKTLMIRRELEKDPNLKGENWDRFLPKFAVKNVQKKSKKKLKKKPYTPFPPPQMERKVDKELATGEYFLSASEKKNRSLAGKMKRSQENSAKRQALRKSHFMPPEEPQTSKKPNRKESDDVDVERLKKKIKESKLKKKVLTGKKPLPSKRKPISTA